MLCWTLWAVEDLSSFNMLSWHPRRSGSVAQLMPISKAVSRLFSHFLLRGVHKRQPSMEGCSRSTFWTSFSLRYGREDWVFASVRKQSGRSHALPPKPFQHFRQDLEMQGARCLQEAVTTVCKGATFRHMKQWNNETSKKSRSGSFFLMFFFFFFFFFRTFHGRCWNHFGGRTLRPTGRPGAFHLRRSHWQLGERLFWILLVERKTSALTVSNILAALSLLLASMLPHKGKHPRSKRQIWWCGATTTWWMISTLRTIGPPTACFLGFEEFEGLLQLRDYCPALVQRAMSTYRSLLCFEFFSSRKIMFHCCEIGFRFAYIIPWITEWCNYGCCSSRVGNECFRRMYQRQLWDPNCGGELTLKEQAVQ